VYRLPTGEVDFQRLFMVPAWLGVAALILLLVAFHPQPTREKVRESRVAA
jgi:hypothetical protein